MFIKQLFLLFTILLFALSLSLKAQITEAYRWKIAQNYLQSSFNDELHSSKLSQAVSPIIYGADTLAFVYKLKPKGYIVLSTSKDISPVIAFSTEADFDFSHSKDNILLQMLYTDLSQRMAFSKSKTAKALKKKQENNAKWDYLAHTSTFTKTFTTQYGPLLSSVWGGVNCVDDFWNKIYVGNYYTPKHYSPGCVATSTSIVMHYYKWPKQGVGDHTDYDNTGSSRGSYYANFGATTYLWGRMLDKYYNKKSKEKHREAMGKLAYHCAIAFDMNFEYNGSTSNLNRTPLALDKYFRYSSHYESSTWYSFWPRLRKNIRNGQPVTIAISKKNGEGHAIVCDGYGQNSGQPNYYHLQFGWWGSYNGWYDIQGSWDANGYTIIDGAVFDILPDPAIGAPIYGSDPFDVSVPILVSDSLHWESFKIWESYNGGSYHLVESNFKSLTYKPNITKSGNYKYKVQAKVNGTYYANSTSLPGEVLVKRKDSALVNLDFDGDDSFFVKDNAFNDLDIKDNYTIETWLRVHKLNPNSNWDVIMDRRTVFSLYLISDDDADYAIRFVTRNGSDHLVASLRSDSSEVNLHFGQWVHVAIARNKGITSLFLNGKEVDSSLDTNFSLRYSIYALNFGARYWGSYSRYLIGELDEIRISDTARYFHKQDFSPYRCMPFLPDSNTLLLLHLDENSGNSLGDDSRHFFNTNLRSTPNYANWKKANQGVSVVYNQAFEAKTLIHPVGQSVMLTWATSFEHDNEGFDIYRSKDKKEWDFLTHIKGSNGGNKLVNYQFEDKEVALGEHFYKLKQIYTACKYTFAGEDSVTILPKNSLSIYPNPASDYLFIEGLQGHNIKSIEVYDILGNKITTELRPDYSLDIRNLSSGMYFIRIELPDQNYLQKFMVVKTGK